MILIFFNLLINATFSLITGLLIVGFFIWFFRVDVGPWKVFLLSLPFVKILYDLVRGVPSNSVLLTSIDPYSLPSKHQTLQIGAGFSEWGPTVHTLLSVKDLDGKEYPSSIGDYLTIWVHRTFGLNVSLFIVCGIIIIATFLVSVRMIQAFKFEKKRRKDRLTAKSLRKIKILFRSVDVYATNGFTGTPFTGGFFKPYICIPFGAQAMLTADELESVIFHELGHICQFDLLVSLAIQILGDLFWFIPGYRWLAKKIDSLREIVADCWAVKKGAEPALLASALIKLKKIPEQPDDLVLYSAFFRKRSLLKERVERLLGNNNDQLPRFYWKFKIVKLIAAFWIFMAVMISTFGGNHVSKPLKNPEWFNQLLNSLGIS